MSSKQKPYVSPEKRTQEVVTQDSVVRDEMIVPEEKPTELQLMMRMFSMDRQQRMERDQRMDSMMEHFFDSQSKLAERLDLVYEDIEKFHQAPRVTTNTSPNGQICLDGDDDADEQGGGKVFSTEPALKVSPIDQASDQSPGEEHFFFGFSELWIPEKSATQEAFWL
jgi:hypothetical protein